MAYPTVDKPYGFRPVNLLGGQVYAGSTRQIPIESGWGTAIFYGDVVLMSASGCVVGGGTTVNTTTSVQVAGVFLGCSYINSAGQRIYAQYYPASTTGTPDSANSIQAYVADDPDLVMRCAIVSSGTTVAQAARSSLVGGNAQLVNNIGSTTTGDSQQAILNAAGTTSTYTFKVVDVVPDTATAAGSFVEVLVTWTQGVHIYRGATGI
jgi:hypothetical protein